MTSITTSRQNDSVLGTMPRMYGSEKYSAFTPESIRQSASGHCTVVFSKMLWYENDQMCVVVVRHRHTPGIFTKNLSSTTTAVYTMMKFQNGFFGFGRLASAT